jgi:hypothetical protein
MTPRSLFAIIIKTVALYLLIGSLIAIPQFINTAIYYLHPISGPGESATGNLIAPILILIVIIGFYIFFFWLCFVRTNWIIDKLRLDQGFNEEAFSINIHRSTVLRIIVIVTGILIAADSLPLVFRNLVSYLGETNAYVSFTHNSSAGWLTYYFIKFSIGFSLVAANRPVVNFIELRRKA